MLQLSVLALTLCAGTLVEPFRIAEAEPGHHQSYPCVAMAPDGHFAVAWIDSIASGDPFNPDDLELDLFVRFFDRDGNPMTDAYQIAKMADTNWVHYPWLEMDTAGNAVLLWVDRETRSAEQPSYVRFQRFGPDGSPVGSAHTVVARVFLYKRSPIDLSLNNRGEFAVTWLEVIPPYWELTCVWVQRFDLEGYPEDRAFLPHDIPGNYLLPFTFPRVALNDEGDLVVTWRDEPNPDTVYRRFQVFDAADEPVLSWRSRGHLLDYEEWGRWAEPYWLDDERFVAFWTYGGLVGGVFGHRGLARYPIRLVMIDPHEVGAWEKMFSVAFFADGRFAETHLRRSKLHENWWWERPGGIIGEIRDNEPWRQTNLFEYTLPFEKDTAQGINPVWMAYFVPAVGVCDDRIVWVYPRSTPDSTCEAWALISDWDMGVGVMESPIHTASPIYLEASLNRLSYDLPGEAKLTLYSSDGRMVLEETIKGEGIWQAPSLPSGVYFARVEGESASARAKLVILH
ncbi:T9SS type A sorting domain-containing protein [candidate division WOR-3 bacterium]|nr:T9SS type A sorting domain-containing protein [candidate division WOR-3 bacterium]